MMSKDIQVRALLQGLIYRKSGFVTCQLDTVSSKKFHAESPGGISYRLLEGV
jgi:hypothetical protein